MRLLVDPANLNFVLFGLAALTSAAYFIGVRGKSAATWFMLGFLVAWAINVLVRGLWAFSHAAVATDSAFYTAPLGIATIVVGALAGPMLAQAAYYFRSSPYKREARVVLVVSIASVAACPLLVYANPTLTVAIGQWIIAFWSLWGFVVLIRKQGRSAATGAPRRDRAGMLAVAAFLFVVVLAETVHGLISWRGSPPTVAWTVALAVAQFSVALAFPIVYAQYAPEPTTFQVKLVGFVLLVVLFAFGVQNALNSAMDDWRLAFDPADEPRSVTYTPSGNPSGSLSGNPSGGGYSVAEREVEFVDDIGPSVFDGNVLKDDAKHVLDLPFGFPFGGDTLRTVVVSANGSVEPADEPYPFSSFSVEYQTITERPLIAVWYTDLNPDIGGSVHTRTESDFAVVTWKDIPEWGFYTPYTVQAVLHADGRIVFNYADLPFGPFVGARGVLADPSAAAGDPATSLFSVYDRRIEFKEFVHAEMLPFVRIVFGTLVAILLIAPLFFRRALIKPLSHLLAGMRRVNAGDLDAELPVRVKDEFGQAAENFNSMTQSLRMYAREMESLVEVRTHELNQSLESLKTAQQQLVQQEKMASLGQLTAGIAHEIKNPLNFINNFAELNTELADEISAAIARGEDATQLVADLRQNATVIADQGKRVDGIVKSMMEHARSGAAEKDAVDLNAFVEEYVNLAYHGKRAATPGFDVDLRRSYADDAGTVSMIRQDMGRVLINLLGNAFDAVHAKAKEDPDYAPVVTVSTRREDRGEGSHGGGREGAVVVEICDNGPGVAEADRARIFEPFFTTKPTGQGTGLGLSMSYDIVTNGHGGTLEYHDNDGGGAVFVIRLET